MQIRNLKIRLAGKQDAAALLDIYKPFIEETSITFETETPSVDAFAQRVETYLQQWPWLVCEADGRIAGYAYAGRYRERTAYQWCTESSVYIHPDFLRKGIARALYSALLDILQRQNYYNVYAVINLPNERSVAMHESLGFTWFASYENVGYKLGRWKTVGWWKISLQTYGPDPQPPIPFRELPQDFLPALFAEKCAQYIHT